MLAFRLYKRVKSSRAEATILLTFQMVIKTNGGLCNEEGLNSNLCRNAKSFSVECISIVSVAMALTGTYHTLHFSIPATKFFCLKICFAQIPIK